MDLILERYNAPDHTVIYSRTGSTLISPHTDRMGSPISFGFADGRVVGELVKLDIDQMNNRVQAICRIDEPEAQRMVAEGCMSALSIPARLDENPHLVDMPQPPTSTFKYYAGPREVALQKRFIPGGLNKRRQAAMREIYSFRNSSPSSLHKWQAGYQERRAPVQKTSRQNPNATLIYGSGLEADKAQSAVDLTLRTTARDATEERQKRLNRNAAVIDRTSL
jgi:hypothetical protein